MQTGIGIPASLVNAITLIIVLIIIVVNEVYFNYRYGYGYAFAIQRTQYVNFCTMRYSFLSACVSLVITSL